MAVNMQARLDAQHSIIGAMLMADDVIPKVISQCSEEDFEGAARTVFRTIKRMFLDGIAVDPVSLLHALGSDGYREFIIGCMDITPTAANVDQHIRICREQAKIQRANEIGRQLAEMTDFDQIRKLLEIAASLTVDRQSVKIVTMTEALKSFVDRHSRQAEYISWPIKELNSEIFAELGDFIVVGGRPSTGKTALTIQCAYHFAKRYKVGYFSLETSDAKVFDRQISHVARLDMQDIKMSSIPDAGWQAFAEASTEVCAAKLEIIPAAGFSVADIRAIATMRGYEVIIVDYLQLLRAPGENRTAQVTNISIGLHTMAQSMGVMVVALSQLARQGKDGGTPGMDALRESGQIEQDADVVMMLNLEEPKKLPQGQNRILRIEKNKEGTCPQILLSFDGRHQTFAPAKRDKELLSKYVAEGKKARRRSGQSEMEQFSIITGDDPQMPF